MADRPESEAPQGPADNSKAAVPPVAETPATPEISAPMLDVHAPHEGIHTWSDFFTHIATIVIGLLIAVGLEQTVEYFHHRRQVAEVRESLSVERRFNINRFARTRMLRPRIGRASWIGWR
jgi:hypothetical protein